MSRTFPAARSGHRRRGDRALVGALLLALSAAACSGPREPLDVGVREVASNIVLGAQGGRVDRPVAAPIPPAPVAVNLPTPARVPAPPRFAPTPTPAPPIEDPCPTADPLFVPAHAAPDDLGEPPVEESFAYRNDGTFSVSGPNANEGVFDQPSTRAIEEVLVDPDGDVTYDVVAELAGTTTRSSYLVRNARPVEDPLGVGDQAGLDPQRGFYLTAVESTLPDGSTTTFAPAAPLRLLRFPAFVGDTFDAVGTDPLSGTTMQYTATVAARARVDACGELIDAIRVELTEGRIDGPNANVEFAATYDIATQYGGLIVRDQVAVSGREGLDNVTRSNIATISRVPTHHSEVPA